MEEYRDVLQMQARLSYLTNQIEQMQWELARLSREAQISNASITAVRKFLLNSDAQTQTHKLLSQMVAQLESHQEEAEELTKTVKKLSRTQFKANALDESKEQQMAQTIALLQELATKREDTRTARQQEDREHVQALQAEARAEVAAAFLPVLDGIEMALAHQPARPAPPSPERREDESASRPDSSAGFFHKLFHPGEKQPVVAPQLSQPQADMLKTLEEMHTAMQRWAHGLEIVRERFLSLLEREGIQPIPDLGATFDPHLHVAVDTEERTDAAENTIVSVIRKGYRHHERVLRYAEVIVAKTPQQQDDNSEDQPEPDRGNEHEPRIPKPPVTLEDEDVENMDTEEESARIA